jgi:hypothetical protein
MRESLMRLRLRLCRLRCRSAEDRGQNAEVETDSAVLLHSEF